MSLKLRRFGPLTIAQPTAAAPAVVAADVLQAAADERDLAQP